MVRRTVAQERLSFQLEQTGDTITGRAGLALFQEAALALGVRRSINENLPPPGSGRGFKPQEYVLPLVLMLCGGGRTLEDIREIELDDGLVKAAPLLQMDDEDWRSLLGQEVGAFEREHLLRHIGSGRPLGSEGFTREVERLTGRTLRRQQPGPKGPWKYQNRPKET